MPLTGNYTADVPQGTQQINNTQLPINYNFQDIHDLIGVNHVNFNTANTFGEHNLLTYYNQTSDPTTNANEMALYSKSVSNSNGAELFYRYPNNGSVVQLTGSSAPTPSGYASGNQYTNLNINGFVYPALGYQYLSNGLLMKWGQYWVYPTSGSSQVWSVPIPTNSTQIPPFTTAIYNIQCVSDNDGLSSGTTSATPPQGLVYATTSSLNAFNVGTVGTLYSGTTYRAIIVNWTIIGV